MSEVVTIRKSRNDWPSRTFCPGDYVSIDEQQESTEAPLLLVAFIREGPFSNRFGQDTIVIHEPGQHVFTGTGRPRVYRGARYRVFVTISFIDVEREPLVFRCEEIGSFPARISAV